LISNRKKPIYVITGGHPVHKGKKVKEFVVSLKGRLSIFILPPYAPDLNPDELMWNYMRQTGTARLPFKKRRITVGENIHRFGVDCSE